MEATLQEPCRKRLSWAMPASLIRRDNVRTSVVQPKSKPAILTPANLTPAATVRAALKATIEPARSLEMERIAKE